VLAVRAAVRSENGKNMPHTMRNYGVGLCRVLLSYTRLSLRIVLNQTGATVPWGSLFVNFFLKSSATIAPCCSCHPLFINPFLILLER
jgi:hypothetical protein